MTTLYVILAVLVYVGLFLLTYAMYFAYWQREFPDHAKEDSRDDMWFSLKWSAFPPLSTVLVYFATERAKHGLLFFPEHTKQEGTASNK